MTRFEDTVKALSGAIEESRQEDDLENQETDLLAQKLLKGKLDPEKVKVNLDSVNRELTQYRDQLKTFLNSNLQAEIGQSLQNAGKTVSLVEKLKQDTNTALDESRDLETLAQHLQSRKIAQVADTEKERINELGRKLQTIDQKSQRVERLVGRLQQMLDDSGIELENLNQEIKRRIRAVNRMLEKTGEETGEKNRQERDTLEHNLGIARKYFERVYGDVLRETEFLAFNRISQARSYLKNNREEMDRLEQGFDKAIKRLEQKPNRARCVSIGTESVTALSIIYIPNGFTGVFFEELFHAINRIDSSYDEETYVPIAAFLGSLWARQQGYLQGNPDTEKLVEDVIGSGSFTSRGYSYPTEEVRDKYKGREVTAKLLEKFVREGLERSEMERVAVKVYKDIIRSKKTASQIIKHELNRLDTAGTTSKDQSPKEWEELLKNPGKYIEPGEDLDIDSEGLSPYKPQGWTSYPEYPPQHTTPKQGFKFHISASPEEGYKVCKELIPILQAFNIDHKIIKSLRYIKNNMDDKPLQRKKLMTIYPGSSMDSENQVFEAGNKKRNKESYIANEPYTRKILKNLIKYADENILEGGPKLEDRRQTLGTEFEAEEPRAKGTRIHLTYSIVSGRNKLRTIIDQEGNRFEDIRHYIAETDDDGSLKRDDSGTFNQYPINEQSFHGSDTKSDYFLDHLITKEKSDKIKKNLATHNPENAIFGYDAKVCGAHYLIPKEGYHRINKIISDVFDDLSS